MARQQMLDDAEVNEGVVGHPALQVPGDCQDDRWSRRDKQGRSP
jgi:hypothetical protein